MNCCPKTIVSCLAGLIGLLVLPGIKVSHATDIDFQRDVQPILSEHCADCHGPDAAAAKSGLRLDSRDMALQGGESGTPAIVPNKPMESELIQRVSSTDADRIMPPPKENKPTDASANRGPDTMDQRRRQLLHALGLRVTGRRRLGPKEGRLIPSMRSSPRG